MIFNFWHFILFYLFFQGTGFSLLKYKMVLWISPKLWNKIRIKCILHWRTDLWVIRKWVGNKWEWYFFSRWGRPDIQDGTLYLQWIIRFYSRKLIKNSFNGFLNDIGKHRDGLSEAFLSPETYFLISSRENLILLLGKYLI